MGARKLHIAFAFALAACGGPTTPPPNPGVLSMTLTPSTLSVTGLETTTAKVPLMNVTVLGDVAPDGRSMIAELDLDALAGAKEYSFSTLPQGVYSVISFNFGASQFEGTWRGMPLHIHLEADDVRTPTQLRSPSGFEIGPGMDAALSIAVDTSSWFAGNLLDRATPVAGVITIGDNSNEPVAEQLASQIAASFSLQ
jgi:hypothetical protein